MEQPYIFKIIRNKSSGVFLAKPTLDLFRYNLIPTEICSAENLSQILISRKYRVMPPECLGNFFLPAANFLSQ